MHKLQKQWIEGSYWVAFSATAVGILCDSSNDIGAG
jgi:hypothetical protein